MCIVRVVFAKNRRLLREGLERFCTFYFMLTRHNRIRYKAQMSNGKNEIV